MPESCPLGRHQEGTAGKLLSEIGQVAYQIEGNEESNSMLTEKSKQKSHIYDLWSWGDENQRFQKVVMLPI